jgi:hypothetical protein
VGRVAAPEQADSLPSPSGRRPLRPGSASFRGVRVWGNNGDGAPGEPRRVGRYARRRTNSLLRMPVEVDADLTAGRTYLASSSVCQESQQVGYLFIFN